MRLCRGVTLAARCEQDSLHVSNFNQLLSNISCAEGFSTRTPEPWAWVDEEVPA